MPSNSLTMPSPGLVTAAGIALAIGLTASPLLVCVAIVAPLCIWRLSRGLPRDERSFLIGMLAVALLLRGALVAAQMFRGLPLLNDMSVGALAGDESYYLSRAIRVRDLLAGYAATSYDYFVATDEYGETSYLTVLTWLQVALGPTPYSMKIVNGVLQVCGAALLFRMARTAFGTLPAFLGLAITLFLPSLLFLSVSLLKESSYFLINSICVVCAWRLLTAARDRHWGSALSMSAAVGISLWLLDGLRRGAVVLIGGGLVIGIALWFIGQSRRRLAFTMAASAVAAMIVLFVPSLHQRALTTIADVAKMQAGHVFTEGHVYKLMDEGFYRTPEIGAQWDLRLSDGEAARFVARALASFVVTPWPWEMRSARELAFLPEHMVWYVLMAALPFGVVAAWRMNPLATALLCGFAIPTALVIALTNGNVGTLLRLRGLVTPYIAWLSAIGICVIGEWLAAIRSTRSPLQERPAL